jgi:hypothetical protein
VYNSLRRRSTTIRSVELQMFGLVLLRGRLTLVHVAERLEP